MNNVLPLIFLLEQTLTAMIQQGKEEVSHLVRSTMDVEEEEVGPEEEVDLKMESVEL